VIFRFYHRTILVLGAKLPVCFRLVLGQKDQSLLYLIDLQLVSNNIAGTAEKNALPTGARLPELTGLY
jgi:hypothetical protein